MRALAWWHGIQRPPEDATEVQKADRRSRMTVCKDEGGEPYLPPLEAALQPFVAMLFEAGPASNAGQGQQITLTWPDLLAWMRCLGVRHTPRTLHLLRRLSSAYLIELQRADAPDALPPWEPELPKWKKRQAELRKLARL